VSCSICEKRKEKRFCPAVHGRICPQCCGESREVTLDCPSDCIYLQQARAHEKPRKADELDPKLLFLKVEIPEQFVYQHEHLIVGLSFALYKSARLHRDIVDHDLVVALTSMAQAYGTLVNSGLHYESQITSVTQQAVIQEVQTMVKEYREAEQKHTGQTSLRDADVLRALVFLARMAQARTSGRPRSRAYLDFLFTQFPEKDSVIAGAGDTPSRIIVP